MDDLAARHIHGQGTPEAAWQACPQLQALPPVELDELVPPHATAFVVAPHPDDEVLGAGGLIALLRAAGRAVQVVLATDGSASHAQSALWPARRLAAARALETRAALKCLAADGVDVWELRIRDGTLARQEEQLARVLSWRVGEGDVVVTTWRLDGHPDHEAAARACEACARLRGATLLEMPIWGWHWMQPGDAAFPWQRACRLELPPAIARAKRRAAQAFRSQLQPDASSGQAPVLPAWALQRMLRSFEVFVR